MYTIRHMEQAIADCEKGEFLQAVHFWDQAVALYTGSRGLKEGNNGDLMLHQADLRCQEFHTCGDQSQDGEGKSYVNLHLLDIGIASEYVLETFKVTWCMRDNDLCSIIGHGAPRDGIEANPCLFKEVPYLHFGILFAQICSIV